MDACHNQLILPVFTCWSIDTPLIFSSVVLLRLTLIRNKPAAAALLPPLSDWSCSGNSQPVDPHAQIQACIHPLEMARLHCHSHIHIFLFLLTILKKYTCSQIDTLWSVERRFKGNESGPVEETDGLIERGRRRELETEMKRNEVRQRESRAWEGEDECVGGWRGANEVFVTLLLEKDWKRSRGMSGGYIHVKLFVLLKCCSSLVQLIFIYTFIITLCLSVTCL